MLKFSLQAIPTVTFFVETFHLFLYIRCFLLVRAVMDPENTWCKGRIHHRQDADPPQDFIKWGEPVQLTWSMCQELAKPIRIGLQYWRHHVLPCRSLVMLFVPSPRPSNRHHVFLLVPNNLHAHVFPLRIRLRVRSLCLLIVFLFFFFFFFTLHLFTVYWKIMDYPLVYLNDSFCFPKLRQHNTRQPSKSHNTVIISQVWIFNVY